MSSLAAAAWLAPVVALAQAAQPPTPPTTPTGAPPEALPPETPPTAPSATTEPAPIVPAPEPAPAPATPAPALPAPTAAPIEEPAAVAAPVDKDEMSPTDPLAGWSSDTVYLRSADNEFVLMPGGRLQIDGYFFKRDSDKMPTPSFLLRRARLEVAGWVGSWVFYGFGGDFAAGPPAAGQTWLSTTDDFVGIAPWKNLAMLQVGQFDAPFTLENRTSDKYFDFMERSITVRAFGIPSNKESGAMVNGLLPSKVAYYSLGLFNGDGQNFRNVDAKFDVMGRVWLAPFALAGQKSLEDVEIGGSMWLGNRGTNGTLLGAQTTQGGVNFLNPTWRNTPMVGAAQPVEVHQRGKMQAFAAELHVPVEHKYGARVEFVHKRQDLIAADATNAASLVSLSAGRLNGWSLYGELWWWAVGDDTILPAPGLELPSRLKKFETKAPRHGVMIAAKVERLNETVRFDAPVTGDAISGIHQVTSFTLGANYWYSKRYRASFNYVFNAFQGNAKSVDALQANLGDHKNDHEFLFRLGIAL